TLSAPTGLIIRAYSYFPVGKLDVQLSNVAIFAAAPGGSPLRFVTVTPCRVADTRNANGAFGGPAITGQTSRDFVIPNSFCDIPATASAYSINVTVVPRGQLGFLTVYPSGQPLP